MKKALFLAFLLNLIVNEIFAQNSREVQIVAKIAENHLSPLTKKAIAGLLGGGTLSGFTKDKATSSDTRENELFTPKHKLLIKGGPTNFTEFLPFLKENTEPNLYTSLIAQEKILKDSAVSPAGRQKALWSFIGLMIAAHMPYNVAFVNEQKMADSIKYHSKKTKIRELWQGKLIDGRRDNDLKLASDFENETPGNLKVVRDVNPKFWLWESYSLNKQFYSDLSGGYNPEDAFYKKYEQILISRVTVAGLRLAAILNHMYPTNPKSFVLHPEHPVEYLAPPYAIHIPLAAIGSNLNRYVFVTGKVFGYVRSADSALVYVGGNFPDQLLTINLKDSAKTLIAGMADKTISVEGKVDHLRGKPMIQVSDPKKILVLNDSEITK